MDSSLDIIIVNWNAGRQLYNCLESIESTSKEGFHIDNVIVVDNASTDNSIDELSTINIPLRIIKNQTNKGFAAACNQGARKSKAEFLLFLNPDTVLYENSLCKAINYMKKRDNSNTGVCGIKLIDEENKIHKSCCYYPKSRHFLNRILGLNYLLPHKFKTHFMTDWEHNNNSSVDHVIGAFYLIRKSIFEKVNGFDERFFVYLEDIDLSLRVRKLGYGLVYLAESEAFHKGGGTSEQVKATRLFFSIRSRILYSFKHFKLSSAIILFFASLIIEPLTRICLGLIKSSRQDVLETIKAYGMLFKDIPNILRVIK
jgi:N-acetylglucosaminyl-diphospho-decaprenol L-rhamnosyltransferase